MKTAVLLVIAFLMGGCSLVPADWRHDQTTCPVHGTALKEETRDINYGLYPYVDGYNQAEEKQFPMANTRLGGGCNVPDWPRRARIMYCDQCRIAEREWWAEHNQAAPVKQTPAPAPAAEPAPTCQVHHVPLVQDSVEIKYGLYDIPSEYRQARRLGFPNSNVSVLGGCVVRDQTSAPVLYCPECRAARDAWITTHGFADYHMPD